MADGYGSCKQDLEDKGELCPGHHQHRKAMNRKTLIRSLVAAAFMVVLYSPADAAFSFRKQITINSGQVSGPTNLADFPVLISITGDVNLRTTANGGNVQDPNGHDIIFRAEDTTTCNGPATCILDHEIESYDGANGDLVAWVRVPVLQNAVNTNIYIYYGDSAVTCSQENASGVWDANYREVFHLNETGDHTDSTANGFTAVAKGTVTRGAAGKIGLADEFHGPTESRLIASDGTLTSTSPHTIEAWFFVENLQGPAFTAVATKGRDNSTAWSGLFIDGADRIVFGWECPLCNLNGSVLNSGRWYYGAATYDGANLRLYLGDSNTSTFGLDAGPVAGTHPVDIPEYLRIGDDSNGEYFDGIIDEVRVSNVARSSDWLTTTFNNHDTPGTFYSVGAQDASPPVVAVSCPAIEAPCEGIGSGTCHLRSIGAAADYTDGIGVSATNGSVVVTGSGTTWQTANRGPGDRITIAGTPYTVLAVDSEASLRLTSPFTGATGPGQAYTIARKFADPSAWEDCIDGPGGAGCEGVSSSSLVGDNRGEIGFVYKDGIYIPPAVGTPILHVAGSTTDATHTIRLTVADGNKHFGIVASGVVLNNAVNTVRAVYIQDDHVAIEWLEILGGSGGSAHGIDVNNIGPQNRLFIQDNLIHADGYGIRINDAEAVVDIFNNFLYRNAREAVLVNLSMLPGSSVRILNNTIFDNNPATSNGADVRANLVSTTNPYILLRNNIIVDDSDSPDFDMPWVNVGSSNNLSGDTAPPSGPFTPDAGHSPRGGGIYSVTEAGPSFVSTGLGTEDLHIQGGSVAVDVAASLTSIFATDIDGELRGFQWEIGADDLGRTWYDNNWGARRLLTFDNVGRGDLTDFPVLICLDGSKIDYNKTDGDDLRFVDANDTDLLNHEIELWDEGGISYVWVKVPQIDGGSNEDFIYMYYDNQGEPPPSQASQQATWTNSFESVYHLHDDFADSSGNQVAGTNVGSADGSSSRLVGDYQTFTGDSGGREYINTNWTPAYLSNEDFTWEGWFNVSASGVQSTDALLGIEDRFLGAGNNTEVRLAPRDGIGGAPNPDQWDIILRPNSPAGYFNTTITEFPVTTEDWHHLAIVRDGSTARTYFDGGEVDNNAVGTSALDFPTRSWSTTVTLLIGAQFNTDGADGSQRNWFQGGLDEIRTSSNVARSADWMDATFDTIKNCGAFTSFTAEATAVELVSFEAIGVDGAVELRWETGSELENLGFHLYRSKAEEGSYEQITSRVIPGLGSSPQGAKYAYRDSDLTNGATYYYKLEDIETTGVTEFHGPVSATPATEVVVEDDPEGEGGSTGDELGELSSRITFGNPLANGLKVRRRGKKWMELELITEGFYAIPQDDGSVLLDVPGFEDFGGPDLPDVPAYRTWQDVLAGRNVRMASVKVGGVAEFASVRPSSSELIVVASGDGTVSTGRRRKKRRHPPHVYYPESWAKLMSVGFQGPAKKALVEMAPLRWDATAEKLVLARRIVVRIAFKGKDKAELQLGKSHREVGSHANRSVYARIAVTEPGLYAVSYESVFGKRRKAIKTSHLRLSRQGEPVAFFVSPNQKKFKKKSKLYFLSDGADLNPYGQEAVYELEASQQGLHMESLNGAPTGAPTSFYWKTVEREENLLYQAAFEGEEDIWQWDWLFGPMTNGYPFEVSNLSPVAENSKLRVWLHGASDFPEDPDHHVRLYINGILLNETWWDGETPHFVEAELGPGLLHERENTLEIEEVGDTEAQYSMVMLDRFEVSYPAQLVGELKGSFSESGVATLVGTSAEIFDLTEPEPKRLTGVGTSFRAESGHRYFSTGSVKTPEVRPAQSSGLKKAWSRAEYLVIGPRAFLAAAEPLLDHRRNEGLITGAIATEDIFDEFGYGEATPESIKDFLSYVYHHWSEPTLRYVVLLGDSTYDTKDYLATGVKSHVPVKIVETRYMWTASDPWFGAINGDDILPDVAIGRLPAASVEEVQSLVGKILAYETEEGDPEAPFVLVTDNPDIAGNFDADAEEIASTLLKEEGVEKIYLSQLGAAGAHGAIRNVFDEGASLISYMGHGAIHLWANENLLNIWDVDSLSPQSQQPFLLTMNCLNGYFHFPYFNSLSEELLKAEGKGIIAAFSPTGLSLNSPAHRFHKLLLDHIVHQNHERLGDAILAGQGAYAHSGAFPELLSIYHLLGDPALRLR